MRPTKSKRIVFFVSMDITVIIVSLFASFLLRFDFNIPFLYRRTIVDILPLVLMIKLFSFMLFRLYTVSWRYICLTDMWSIFKAIFFANLVISIFIYALIPNYSVFSLLNKNYFSGFPRSVIVIDGIMTFFLIASMRTSGRFFFEVVKDKKSVIKGQRTLIVGAGNITDMILRDIGRNASEDFYPVALIDDDSQKINTYIHGVKVVGNLSELDRYIIKYDIEAIIIASTSLSYNTVRDIYNIAKAFKINTIKIIPPIYASYKPSLSVKSLDDISIEDLIGRKQVSINFNEIEMLLKDMVILVTGGGGSIGSEIVAQVCNFNPLSVVIADHDETALHNVMIKIKHTLPQIIGRVHPVVVNIKEHDRLYEVFSMCNPNVVFHAAAYKHVPIMEHNPKEAVSVNILGTYNVATIAMEKKVNKFILISTDKAIRPSSIMGATKRIAEILCKDLNQAGVTEFISVRFGNVLGSRGSVLPLFLDQLKHGGPLTVTHKDMQRYFMTIPEAASLVLQASSIGKGGDLLVLDMGEPVSIVKLAEELIRLHDFTPYKDIDIEFIGMRPGEKLFEELLTAEEHNNVSKHNKIFIAKDDGRVDISKVDPMVDDFETYVKTATLNDRGELIRLLNKYITMYKQVDARYS
ncbi:MAG: polysaccharide biosynthesis protein [Nitrospirae bacterium]|nr:polysaccharide biosynthesis protein [Nitrospirota bacterium]